MPADYRGCVRIFNGVVQQHADDRYTLQINQTDIAMGQVRTIAHVGTKALLDKKIPFPVNAIIEHDDPMNALKSTVQQRLVLHTGTYTSFDVMEIAQSRRGLTVILLSFANCFRFPGTDIDYNAVLATEYVPGRPVEPVAAIAGLTIKR